MKQFILFILLFLVIIMLLSGCAELREHLVTDQTPLVPQRVGLSPSYNNIDER